MSLRLESIGKIKIMFLGETPIGCTFRYNKESYKRISFNLARNMDFETQDFLDIDKFNKFNFCVVPPDVKQDLELMGIKGY